MTRLYVRVDDELAEKVEKKAKSEGFIKPSGGSNKSAYLRKIIKEAVSMTKEEMIKEMAGQRVQVNAEWLEKNDQGLLDWVASNKSWGRGFDEVPDRDTAIVRIEFDERGTRVYATTSIVDDVQQSLNNQPAWGEDSYEDWTKEELEKYLELI